MIRVNASSSFASGHVCDSGRLLQAKGLRNKVIAVEYSRVYTPRDGYFFCYQESGDKQHVCVVQMSRGNVIASRGTGGTRDLGYYIGWSDTFYE
jgi:hypothetical protein